MMASSSSVADLTAAPAKSTLAQQPVLTEVPDNLKRLLLTLAKQFYGLECYVVFDYIQKRVILKEEELRDVCKIDLRQLRKFLATLKVDKFIKERLVPEEVDGKIRKFTYYFVNYKGALNVTKYKIDHIRQKLEGREKDDVHRAHYRCTTELCRRQYDAMDMGKIFDPFTQEMRCWQCHGMVEQDESGGPSQVTRSSMAKFNEQMATIYSLLTQMDGLRFGREITEPAIQAPIPKMEGDTIELEARKVINLGQRAFSTAGKTRTDLYGGEITVSIGEDNAQRGTEAKVQIPWLLTSRQNLAEEDAAASSSSATAELLPHLDGFAAETATLLKREHAEGGSDVEEDEPIAAKRSRRGEIQSLLAIEEEEEYVVVMEKSENGGGRMEVVEAQTSSITIEERIRIEDGEEEEQREENDGDGVADGEADEDQNDDEFVLVQGERVHIDEIDEQKLDRMSEEEKADYYERMKGAYADFY